MVEKVRRTVKVWGDRRVFSMRFVLDLLAGLDNYREGGSGLAPVMEQQSVAAPTAGSVAASPKPSSPTSSDKRSSVTTSDDDEGGEEDVENGTEEGTEGTAD